ncbi:hypothetical protein C6P40_000131 [Pichia californica]|uniref:Uncharacterized protein n=1 Tax=Pichia californica TaxID=460514 RepID=A0A9P7BGS3_9ASCO|nr:hypothetical protein C6P40_000131 [[Candida] californica]
MDRTDFSFHNWKPNLIYNNDIDVIDDQSYQKSQQFLFNKLTRLHNALHPINQSYDIKYNDDLLFAFTQLNDLIDYLLLTYEKSKDIKLLSVNINNLLAKTLTFILSIMMKNGHEKFNILLIELINKLNNLLILNVKKLSMSKNWYSSLKHLSIIILQYIFTKF